MKNIAVAIGLALVGCGGARTDRVCIAHARGVCSAYEVQRPTESEARQDKLDRQTAAMRGVPYVPSWREGESAQAHLDRMTEEHDRQAATARGETYLPPQRSGESSSSWMKRVQSGSSGDSSGPSLGAMPSLGSSTGNTGSFSSGTRR